MREELSISLKNTEPDHIKIELESRPVEYRETGSYSLLPSETIKKIYTVACKVGIDTVKKIDSRYTDGVPIYRINEATERAKCHRALYLWSSPPSPLNNPVRETYGKGITAKQSKVSAMMEAVERYSAQQFEHHKVIHASSQELGDLAIQPSQLKLPTLPLKCIHCPARGSTCFQDLRNVCQEWCWGYSLVYDRPTLVPAALVYYPYLSSDKQSFIYNDTGGLAAGNTLEEAILHGIAEIIERDALYHVYNLEHLDSMQLIDTGRTKNRHLQDFVRNVLPLESIFIFRLRNNELDLDIDTFSGFICYLTGDGRRFFGGSGTSLDPEVGMLRALTELEQQKVRQKAFSIFRQQELVTYIKTNLTEAQSIALEAIPNHSTNDVKADIKFCLNQLVKNNMDVIVTDLTHPEIGIPVVRVIIPGLIAYSGSLIKESTLIAIMNKFGGNCP